MGNTCTNDIAPHQSALHDKAALDPQANACCVVLNTNFLFGNAASTPEGVATLSPPPAPVLSAIG